ncbi:M56 family metallopeptidase [Hellea sp.]|nr:M56 family metallopeptidase [Hellea sp.]
MIDWGLETGIAVSLLIVLVLLVRRPFARMFGAGATYALWALPLVRLFLPEITIPVFKENVPNILTNIALSETIQPSLAVTKPVADISEGFNIGLGFAVMWVAIGIIWFTYQILRQSAFMSRLRLETQTAPQRLQPEINKAMATLNLRRCPDIRLSKDNMGPIITGVIKPIIILPHNFCEDYTLAQQHFALVHEFAHIKRFDLWAAFVVLMFRAVNWPNPLVHYAAHKFRVDQEAACDSFVLSKIKGGSTATQSYAETLVHAAKLGKSQKLSVPLSLALAQQNEDKNDD